MKKFLLLTMTLMILMSTLSIAESDTVWTKEIGSEVKTVKFSPDGRFIYAAAIGRKPMKLSTETGDILKEYEGFFYEASEHYSALDISSDGKWLVGGEYGNNIYIFDTETGSIVKTLKTNHEEWISNKFNTVSISSDNRYVISTNRFGIGDSPFNAIVIWDINQIEPTEVILSKNAMKVEISPDNQYFAVSYERWEGSNSLPSEIVLYQIGTWQPVKTLGTHEKIVKDISFSPDGSLLASCGWDGYIKIWDVNQKKLVKEFGGNIEVNSVGFIGNDKVIGGCGTFQNRYVKIWDLTTEKFLGQIKTNMQLDLDISEIKHYCVVANASSGIFLFDYLKIITGISDYKISKDDRITPNPTNNISEINFFLPISGKTFVSITDANSREIEILFDGFLEQGEHKFLWIPTGVSNGIYFCNITGKNFSKTLKIIFEK